MGAARQVATAITAGKGRIARKHSHLDKELSAETLSDELAWEK
jgi:hypothetical protein